MEPEQHGEAGLSDAHARHCDSSQEESISTEKEDLSQNRGPTSVVPVMAGTPSTSAPSKTPAQPSPSDQYIRKELDLLKAQIQLLESRLGLSQKTRGSTSTPIPTTLLHEPPDGDLKAVTPTPRTTKAEEAPDDPKSNVFVKATFTINPILRRVDWGEFNNRYVSDGQSMPAVEVLFDRPIFYWEKKRRDLASKTARGSTASAVVPSIDPAGKVSGSNGKDQVPERIRINSTLLFAVMYHLDPDPSCSWHLDENPVQFMRPFKYFASVENEFRFWLSHLEYLWGKDEERQEHVDGAKEHTEANADQQNPSTDELGNLKVGKNIDKALSTEVPSEHSAEAQHKAHDAPELSNASEGPTELPQRARYESREAYREFRCLMDILNSSVYPTIHRLRNCQDRDEKVAFADLWHLFQPGTEVVSPENAPLYSLSGRQVDLSSTPVNDKGRRSHLIWKVLNGAQGRPRLRPRREGDFAVAHNMTESNTSPFKIRCYYIDFNGDGFRPVHHIVEIQPFDGEKPISSLDLVPLRLARDPESIREATLERAAMYKELIKPKHKLFTGMTAAKHANGWAVPGSGRTEFIDGPVIVDFKEAAKAHPEWVVKLEHSLPHPLPNDQDEEVDDTPCRVWQDRTQSGECLGEMEELFCSRLEQDLNIKLMTDYIAQDRFLSSFQRHVEDGEMDGSSLTKDDLILLPDRVPAFVLQRRQFYLLPVGGLKPIVGQREGWDDLKLKPGFKKIVQAQVNSHFSDKLDRERAPAEHKTDFDLTRGKGQGLIMCLHGAPGVGKTSTAECMADLLGNPLFPITCGDLGTTAKEVQASLDETFAKAEAWDCLLLLDEADVFMAQRSTYDLERNAIVSVFLRVLEYYEGILFLTSNRIGTLDEAFRSRINIHLYYPPLNEDQTLAIWKSNMRRTIHRKNGALTVDESCIMEYARAYYHQNLKKNTHWNGRQIRSALQAATALAEYDAQKTGESPKLTLGHLNHIVSMSQEFDLYITATMGDETFSERAEQNLHRLDSFNGTPKRQTATPTASTPSYGYTTVQTPPRDPSQPSSTTQFGPVPSYPAYGGYTEAPDTYNMGYNQHQMNQPMQHQMRTPSRPPMQRPMQDAMAFNTPQRAGGMGVPTAHTTENSQMGRMPHPGGEYTYDDDE